jgi:hypothetical protein
VTRIQERYDIVYDAGHRVSAEKLEQRRAESGGPVSYITYTTNSYTGGRLTLSSADVYRGTVDSTGDAAAPDTQTAYAHAWWGDAVTGTITHTPDMAAPGTTHVSTHVYDAMGRLAAVDIADGRRRTASFASSAEGQVLRRTEASAASANPQDQRLYLAGLQVAHVTNDADWEWASVDFASTLSTRNIVHGSGGFGFGRTVPSPGGELGLGGYTPYNPDTLGTAPGSYTARGGETLSAVALQLWGDASLWYKLAEANGLSGAAVLTQGQTLSVPMGVLSSRHNAGTFTPYNPNDALGDLNPFAHTPAARKGNKCGTFGQILVSVVSLAVTALLPAAGGILTAALNGMVSSAAGQLVGMAVGVQDRFNWGGVAMAGIAAGVTMGLGMPIKGLGKAGADGSLFGAMHIGGGGFLAQAAQGAVGGVMSQGIGVAVGLQNKLDFPGIAAAAIGSGLGSRLNLGGLGGRLLSAGADGFATAGIRSILTGTSFGDNLVAVLPSVIGRTVGGWIGDRVAAGSEGVQARVDDAANGAAAFGAGQGTAGPMASTIDDESISVEEAAEIVVTARKGIAQFRSYVTALPIAQQELVKKGLTQGTPAPDFIVSRQSSEVPGFRDILGGKSNPDTTLAGAINELAFFTANTDDDLTGWLFGGRYLDGSDDGIVNMIERLDWETDGNDPMLAGNIAALHATGDPTLVKVAMGLEDVAAGRWQDYGAAAAAEADRTVEEIVRLNPVIDDILLARDAIQGKASGKDIAITVAGHGAGVIGVLGGRLLKAESRIERATRLGREGERAAGIVGPKVGALINGRMRFPDEVTDFLVKEVKNVKYQGWTKQLQDYADLAKQRNIPFELWIRPGPPGVGTTISRVLQRAADEGKVIFKRIGVD